MPPALARGWLRRLLLALVALALLLPVMLLCMWAGEIRMLAGTIGDVLANHLLGAGIDVDPIDDGIVWNYRLTRAIVAACCGAGLAVSGVVLQTLLRNTLADPYLLGISAGASTGAVLVAVAGVGGGMVSMTAGAFAGAVTALRWWRCWLRQPAAADCATAGRSSWRALQGRSSSTRSLR